MFEQNDWGCSITCWKRSIPLRICQNSPRKPNNHNLSARTKELAKANIKRYNKKHQRAAMFVLALGAFYFDGAPLRCARAFGRAEGSFLFVTRHLFLSAQARLGNVAGLLSFVPRLGTGP